jgi:hypothetical protein
MPKDHDPNDPTPAEIAKLARRLSKHIGPPNAAGCRMWRGPRGLKGDARLTFSGKTVAGGRLVMLAETFQLVPARASIRRTCAGGPDCHEPMHLKAFQFEA